MSNVQFLCNVLNFSEPFFIRVKNVLLLSQIDNRNYVSYQKESNSFIPCIKM